MALRPLSESKMLVFAVKRHDLCMSIVGLMLSRRLVRFAPEASSRFRAVWAAGHVPWGEVSAFLTSAQLRSPCLSPTPLLGSYMSL